MTDEIIKLREKLVELSNDPIETRKLLDQLTKEEIDNANIFSPFHVGKDDIVATKDLEYAKVHRLKNGYLLHYHGGYSILVDEKNLSTCGALQMLMDDAPAGPIDPQEREAIELATNAIETVFRLPMFVFSNNTVTFSIAQMGIMYLLLLQEIGEVPTEDSENPEYDRFLMQITKFMEDFAAGLEKEGKEYEKRMGYGEGKDKGQSEDKGESEA